ncbi:MAG: tetratricopeptide repeat protein [Gammaproteobacteria bacterium]|nr:tetratricopeptide repeat protein [Gammaproteobacteria bacterium]
MKLIFGLLLALNVEAGLLDFWHIEQANTAYQNKDYQQAAEKFGEINTDSARLNQANSLYKQGLYAESLEKYQAIEQQDLAFQRLYNSGNAYAKMGKVEEAIRHYQSALKVKPDADAQFNLKLLNKQKKKQDKQQQGKSEDKKQDKDKKHDQKQGKDKSQTNKKQSKDKQKEGKKSQDKKAQDKKDQDKESQGKKGQDKQQQQINKINAIKQRQWEQSLNKKLKTLLIPLNSPQDNNNENNPW